MNNCVSHSRYFSSDELDALFFRKKAEQMFVKCSCIWYNKNMGASCEISIADFPWRAEEIL